MTDLRFPVKGQAPSQTNFKAPANKIEKRQLDNFRRHPEHWLRNATPQSPHLIPPCSFTPAASHRQDVGMRRNLLECDAARHLRHGFPFGQTHDWLLWRRCPAGDPPRVILRYGVVRDTRKAAAQLYSGRQFAIPLIDLPMALRRLR